VSAQAFWAVVFFSAFAAFTVVSALIAVKGVAELRALFRHLAAGRGKPGGDDPPGPQP
jgi:hypothetical protein